MLTFQVVQPFSYAISGDSLNNAIKNFVKINRGLNLTNLIIQDQSRYIDARFKYFFEDGRNKIGINTYPYLGPVTVGPSFMTWYDTLPGASGIPLTPSFPQSEKSVIKAYTPGVSTSFLFSPATPYTPVPVLTDPFIPTIIEINR